MLLIFDLRPLLSQKISGVEVYTKNMAQRIAKELPPDWDLVFWTNAAQKFDFGKYTTLGTCIQTSIPNKLFNISSSFFRFPKIDQLVLQKLKKEKNTPSVLFIPDPRPSPVSKYCKKLMTIHDLSSIHCANTFSFKTRIFHFLSNLKKEIQECSQLIAVSQYTKHDIEKTFLLHPSIEVIYEAADSEINKNIIPKQLPEKLPKKFFLSLSTIEPRKNIKRLILAFSELQKKYPNIYLVLVGRQNNIFQSLSLPSHPNIICIDRFIFLEEKRWLYQKALAFCYISLFEGFGLPLVEAMNESCPIIYGKNSSMIEVAGNAGIGIDAKNIQEITQAMEKYIQDTDFQKEQKVISKKQSRNFSWNKAALKFWELIKNI